MQRITFLGTLLVLAVLITPTSAFTSKSLDISVDAGGSALISLDYELNIFEDIAVWLNIANPADAIKNAIESNTDRPTEVYSVSGSSAVFRVTQFATTSHADGTITQTTPQISFVQAEEALKGQWFSFLISKDLSPTTTTVRFPDGYAQNYTEQLVIPSLTHTSQI
ncbi:MAG: hypothetical protein LUQ13_03845 [Methanomicrobiales archaeon]|nr:hypothetical protein [Methanomicrobiales archaeon]